MSKLPDELCKSLTWDRGKELADHQRFTMETDIDVYFCDPQSPWQRGSNENTNRLLRQYFPKGLDLAQHSQAELNRVARQLNERPRKTLDFESQQSDLANVLRRPVEITTRSRRSPIRPYGNCSAGRAGRSLNPSTPRRCQIPVWVLRLGPPKR